MNKLEFKLWLLKSPLLTSIAFFVNLLGLSIRKSGLNNHFDYKRDIFFRKTKVRVNGKDNYISIGSKCRFKGMKIEVFGNNNNISIGEKVITSGEIYLSVKGNNCNITIGSGTLIGSFDVFVEESGTKVIIGKNCMFGFRISISTTDFHSIVDATTKERINPPQDVTIGEHVWVASSVEINKGVIIADNSIVASNSLVTKKFNQSNVILGGLPAKILKENVNWLDERL